MLIEIWSDVVCPWCYIGKRRLEAALADFDHRDAVEIVWRSYQLDPTTPRGSGERVVDALARKYGQSEDGVRAMMGQVQQVAAEVGLDYSGLAEGRVANTIDAHRLLHAAGDRRDALKEALLDAYFVRGLDVEDHGVLVELAAGVGIDAERAREVLAGDAYADAVRDDIAQAAAYGATGVPFFVIDRRLGISGAQPTEVFSQALAQAWAERPTSPLTTVGGDAPGCEDGVCAT
ncbi:DsbA family oxidoreductase [Nocardioides sp. R-C-SC26]|uniref:DsbA family oxidoreductase n=1 Tax=Nocardioides sp. R-C-SC26 TaxID=2870414 RepID=UPI001E556CD0|nr:DsbA family oxidoreductase [Nocardioides sp. R-C-SC26]